MEKLYTRTEHWRKPVDAAEGYSPMSERPRFFDDLAGVAGGAISALAGLREEAESMIRARTDELIQRLDLVRREELEAVHELAANARAGQEAAEANAAQLETRLKALEARVAVLEAPSADVVAPEGL
jgi:BMFP domain-containing protein YqiC